MNPECILRSFALPDGAVSAVPFGNGHINDTFLVSVEGSPERYILQRINHYVFTRPDQVMENMAHVTAYLRERILEEGGDPRRETLNILPARDGKAYHRDGDGNTWRVLLFVPDTFSPDHPDDPRMLEECGRAFGLFSLRLKDFPADSLYETIPDFHNTPARMEQLETAVRNDKAGRLASVADELAFARSRAEKTFLLLRGHQEGVLPLRVTHNDTKVNNVLFDRESGRAVCVVDLDTVMPGLQGYDFGDAIRVGASTGEEDERDLSRVSLDLSRYEAFARGYLQELGAALSTEELLSLADGAWMMTFENGLRFLADYLNGDVYYKVHRPDQNLDRARAQFALTADMERKADQMRSILLRLGGR